jgi:hypothetical protein
MAGSRIPLPPLSIDLEQSQRRPFYSFHKNLSSQVQPLSQLPMMTRPAFDATSQGLKGSLGLTENAFRPMSAAGFVKAETILAWQK